MTVTLADYIGFLEEYCTFYQTLVDLQDEKLKIILANSVIELDDMVAREQIYVLKARGLEEKRFKMQQKLGYGEKKMQDIIDELVVPEEKKQLQAIKNRLNTLVDIVQRNNTLCAELVDERLTTLDEKIKGLAGQGARTPTHIINKSV